MSTPPAAAAASSVALASIWTRVDKLFTRICESDTHHWFAQPVDPVALNLPDYTEKIPHPMDFSTIRTKRESGAYEDIIAMSEDVHLVFKNARTYNTELHPIHIEAKKLEELFDTRFRPILEEWEEKTGKSASSTSATTSTTGRSPVGKKRKMGGSDQIQHVPITDTNRPLLVSILNDLINWEVSELFKDPVSPEAVPDYHVVIKRPMDLMTIKKQLFARQYQTTAETDADMQLIHDNACLYNSQATTDAKAIRADAKKLLKRWRDRLKAMIDGKIGNSSSSSTATAAAVIDDAETDSDEDDNTSTTSSRATLAKRPKISDKKNRSVSPATTAASSSSNWHVTLMTLFTKFKSQLKPKTLEYFEYPVPQALFADYYEQIKRPICLDDIRINLESKHIYDTKPQLFLADVSLIWENCREYNEPSSDACQEATKAQKAWEKILDTNKELKAMELARKSGGPIKENAIVAAAATADSTKKKATAATKTTASKTVVPSSPSSIAASSTVAPSPSSAAAAAPPSPINALKCRQILSRLSRDRDRISIFQEPVNEMDAKGYSKIIKKQMCISWIQDKLTRETYKTNQEFAMDVEQIWKNCITYNGPLTDYGKLATKFQAEFRQLFLTEFGFPSPGIQVEADAKVKSELDAKMKELARLEAEVAKVKAAKDNTAAAAATTPAVKMETTPTTTPAKPTTAPPPTAAATATPPPPKPTVASTVKLEPLSTSPPAVKQEPTASPPAATSAAASSSTASTTPIKPPTVAPTPPVQTLSIEPTTDFYTPELDDKLSQPIVVASADRLINKLVRDSQSGGFRHPVRVTPDIADYPVIVKQPMDLGTLKTNLTRSLYSTWKQFTNDLELIWSNAIVYNRPLITGPHPVAKTAAILREKSHKMIMEMLTEPSQPVPQEVKPGLPEPVVKKAREVLTHLLKFAPYSHGFFTPIEGAMADYAEYCRKIKHPIDLGKVKARLEKNDYPTLDDYYDDVRLCFQNSIDFHGSRNMYGLQARYLLNEFEWKIKEMESQLTKAQQTTGGPKKGKATIIPPLALLRKATAGGTVIPSAGEASETPSTPMQIDSGDAASTVPPSTPPTLNFPSTTLSPEDYTKCSSIIDKLLNDPQFGIFAIPVDPSLYGGLETYFEIVTVPMDLKLVKRKLALRAYSTTDDFCQDVARISGNVNQFYGVQKTADADAIVSSAQLLTATFEDLWKNYSTIKQPKLKLTTPTLPTTSPSPTVAVTPASNLAPPPLFVAPPTPPIKIEGVSGSPPAVASSATVSATGVPTMTKSGHPVPPGMTLEQYEQWRKEKKKLKKEMKKRKREQAGQIDVAGDSAPNSPEINPTTVSAETIKPMKLEPPVLPIPPSAAGLAVVTTAAAAIPPSPVVPFAVPTPLAPSAPLASTGARFKIPKHPSAAVIGSPPTASGGSGAPEFLSPKKVVQPAPAPAQPRLVFKVATPTGANAVIPPPQRKLIPTRTVNFAQRKRALELAQAKESQLVVPPAFVPMHAPATPAPTASASSASGPSPMEIDADSSSLPSMTPGMASVPSQLVISPRAAPTSTPTAAGPPLAKLQMHRAHSYLASMTTVVERPLGPDGRRARDKKAKKRAEKWKGYQDQCERAQALLNERAKVRAERDGPDGTRVGETLEITPHQISTHELPVYVRHGFVTDLSGSLIRVMHTTLPPTKLFPYPIDQHVLLFATANETLSEVMIDLQVNELGVIQLSRDHVQLFEQWRQLKTLVDETRSVEQIHPTDLSLLQHPLTSSNVLSSDLTFFASLAPSLDWRSTLSCYTHALDFSSVNSSPGAPSTVIKADTDDMSDVEQKVSTSPPATDETEISYETILEMGLHDDTSINESDDETTNDQGHPRPFYGLLSNRCTIPDCLVTPISGGRFYHRCAPQSTNHTLKKRRLSTQSAESTTSSSSISLPTTATASSTRTHPLVGCTGVVIWSLPNSLHIHINGAAYGPAIHETTGLWRQLVQCNCARCTGATTQESESSRLKQLRSINSISHQRRRAMQQELKLY